METSPSFDLNQAIIRWREQLGQTPGFKSRDLDELEIHLRDSAASLQRGNLTAEESFMVATHRIGGAADLSTEFRKVNGTTLWLERALWMLAGVQLFVLVTGLARVTSGLALLLGLTVSLGPRTLALLTPAMYAFAFATVTILAWRLLRNPPVSARRRLTRLLGHSSLTAVVIIFAGALLTVLSYLPTMFLVYSHGIQTTYQAAMMSQRWSNLAAGALSLVFVATAFAWLAKRRLGTVDR